MDDAHNQSLSGFIDLLSKAFGATVLRLEELGEMVREADLLISHITEKFIIKFLTIQVDRLGNYNNTPTYGLPIIIKTTTHYL